jgi:hypothetical protein
MKASIDGQKLQFVHIFNRKLRCKLIYPAQPPSDGKLRFSPQWIGEPKKKHFGEYRRWVLTVNQQLVNQWNAGPMLYALGIALNKTELWEFRPGAAPKLQRIVPIGI